MESRLYQGLWSVACIVAFNFIGWPGPHGGLQYVGQVIWPSQYNSNLTIPFLVIVPMIILLVSSFVPKRKLRIIGTSIAAGWVGILYVMLVLRIYPPVLPIVFMTSVPFLGSLIASIVMSRKPLERLPSPPPLSTATSGTLEDSRSINPFREDKSLE